MLLSDENFEHSGAETLQTLRCQYIPAAVLALLLFTFTGKPKSFVTVTQRNSVTFDYAVLYKCLL